MKSNFRFFLKASTKNFSFDLSQYTSEISHQTANFVFLANDASNIHLSTYPDGIEIAMGYPSLSFMKVHWDGKRYQLSASLDELELMNIFYIKSEDTILLSNSVNILESSPLSGRLSKKALQFFLIAGFLPPSWNLRENIKRVSQKSIWNLSTLSESHHHTEWISNFLSPAQDASPIDTLEVLKESLNLIESEVYPQQLRLSGGADTRLVSFLWQKPIEAVSVHSPWLDSGNDMDVNVAKAWAKQRNLPHRVMYPCEKEFAFFFEETSKPPLTGLCGGEFLGGQFHRVIPSHPENWNHHIKKLLPRASQEEFLNDPWISKVTHNRENWLAECVKVFLQSTRSTIYHSLRGSWMAPYELTYQVVSPFMTPPFLKHFLSLSIETLGDYHFYEKVFEALGSEVRRVPLCSQFTERVLSLKASHAWGQEPKSAKPIQKLLIGENVILRYLEKIMQQQEIDLDPDTLKKALEDPSLRLNVLSIYFWMKPRFNEQTTSGTGLEDSNNFS